MNIVSVFICDRRLLAAEFQDSQKPLTSKWTDRGEVKKEGWRLRRRFHERWVPANNNEQLGGRSQKQDFATGWHKRRTYMTLWVQRRGWCTQRGKDTGQMVPGCKINQITRLNSQKLKSRLKKIDCTTQIMPEYMYEQDWTYLRIATEVVGFADLATFLPPAF